MKTMLKVLAIMVVGGFISGCAMLKQEAASRVDLGDGMVFDVVPVGAAVTGANAVVPGSGEVLAKIEQRLSAKREAKLGPFGGLPYTTARSVVLKNGTVISESEIAKIIETLTPIVPAAVTRVIEPAQFATQPQGTEGTQATEGTNGIVAGDVLDGLLEEIGGVK